MKGLGRGRQVLGETRRGDEGNEEGGVGSRHKVNCHFASEEYKDLSK
jgi:hypothetical protein